PGVPAGRAPALARPRQGAGRAARPAGPAGQQRTRAEARPAVALADLGRLLPDGERGAGPAGQEQLEGPPLERVELAHGVAALGLRQVAVELVEQRAAFLEAERGQVAEVEALHLVARVGGGAEEAGGAPLPAPEAAGLAGLGDVLVEPGPVGQPDDRQRRQLLARLEALDDGAEVRPVARLDGARVGADVLVAGPHPVAGAVVVVVVGVDGADD